MTTNYTRNILKTENFTITLSIEKCGATNENYKRMIMNPSGIQLTNRKYLMRKATGTLNDDEQEEEDGGDGSECT